MEYFYCHIWKQGLKMYREKLVRFVLQIKRIFLEINVQKQTPYKEQLDWKYSYRQQKSKILV